MADPATATGIIAGAASAATGAGVKAAAGGGGSKSLPPYNEGSGVASYRTPAQRKAQQDAAAKALENWTNGVDPSGQQTTDNMILLVGDDAESLGYPRDNKGTLVSRAELAARINKLRQDAEAGVTTNEAGGWSTPDAWNHWKQSSTAQDLLRLQDAKKKADTVTFEESTMDKALGEQGTENAYGDTIAKLKNPNIDQTSFNQTVAAARGHRLEDDDGSLHAIQGLINGTGPTVGGVVAERQAQTDALNNQAMSMAASARGGAGAHSLATRTAIMQGALNNQAGANASAKLRADLATKGIEGLAKRAKDDLDFDQFVAGEKGKFASNDASNFLTNQRDVLNAVGQSKDRAHSWFNTGVNTVETGAGNTRDSADVGTRRMTGNSASDAARFGQTSNIVDSAVGAGAGVGDALASVGKGNGNSGGGKAQGSTGNYNADDSGDITRTNPYGDESTGSTAEGLTGTPVVPINANRRVKNGQIGFGGMF